MMIWIDWFNLSNVYLGIMSCILILVRAIKKTIVSCVFCLVYRVWCIVYGVWCMVYRAWYMICGVYCILQYVLVFCIVYFTLYWLIYTFYLSFNIFRRTLRKRKSISAKITHRTCSNAESTWIHWEPCWRSRERAIWVWQMWYLM